jgi:hypothetical protein
MGLRVRDREALEGGARDAAAGVLDVWGCGQIFARQVSYLVFASLTEDGFETGRCAYWDGKRHPVAREPDALEDYGWRSTSPALDPDLPDFDPRRPPASHVARDALLIIAGTVLALACRIFGRARQ